MKGVRVSLACALILFAVSSIASAAVVEHTFNVQNLTVSRLCNRQVITVVNGSLPGPTVRVKEGDSLVIHVLNNSPHNITIHWHGIFHRLTVWADGPSMITQCPIQPGHSYAYRFNITGQEGTLWWHAHASFLRATVYGALVIRPKSGHSYPFPKPHKEVPILFGEWWNTDVVALEEAAIATGVPPNNSDAFTINGLPGNLYPCSKDRMFSLDVVKGKRYLLRIINAAMNIQMFFKIANHRLTVVAADAVYINPYVTDVIVIAPGQTVDALLYADQSVGSSYYMAAHPYASAPAVPFPNTTTRGVIHYGGASKTQTSKRVLMPKLPSFFDTPTAHRFYSNLTSLVGGPHHVPVPLHVDEEMLITIGLALEACSDNTTCPKFSASMSNHSFVLPKTMSILEAVYNGVDGIFTRDFPDQPPVKFDYTNPNITQTNPELLFAKKSTSAKVLKFNSTVDVVLQNHALMAAENHPMHLHGFNFHVLAQGFGNYDPTRDKSKYYNLVNPQFRNTLAVPVGGWAVIRFTANNPGAWIMHCHIDVHLPFGLGMLFVVENGPTKSTTLPPPPPDLPKC